MSDDQYDEMVEHYRRHIERLTKQRERERGGLYEWSWYGMAPIEREPAEPTPEDLERIEREDTEAMAALGIQWP